MIKNKQETSLQALAEEWKELFASLSKLWLTSETAKDILNNIKSFVTNRPKHYYDVDEFGMDPHLIENIRPLFQFLYYNYWRVGVRGIKNIPSSDKAIIVANHSGGIPFDGTMLNMAIYNEHPRSRNVRFLVEDFVYHFQFLGTLISRTGGVRACPENAKRLLSKKNLIAIFPEGIKGIGKLYKDRYKLLRFGRGGYVKIALRTHTKIIPTAIIGAEETYPILWKTKVLSKPLGIPFFPVTPTFPLLGPLGIIPLPSKWEIIFGKPVSVNKYKPKDADNDLIVHKINMEVREEIKKLIKSALKKRC